MIMNFS